MQNSSRLYQSDLLGVLASGLCAIHCALTPVFFAARPLLEGHHHHGGFWGALDYVFLIVSLLAVWYSARHTSHRTYKWVLWVSWAVFAIGLLSEVLHISWGIWLMYIGSIVLVVSHIQNYRYCRSCKHGKVKS
jgi:hypothetical protein